MAQIRKDRDIVWSLAKSRAVLQQVPRVTTRHKHPALQLFFCKRYKTDQSDDTIGMSPFSISAPKFVGALAA